MGQSPSNFLGFFWWFQLCLGQDFGILFGSAQFSPPSWDYEHSQCAAALGLGLIPNPAQRWLQILRKKKKNRIILHLVVLRIQPGFSKVHQPHQKCSTGVEFLKMELSKHNLSLWMLRTGLLRGGK